MNIHLKKLRFSLPPPLLCRNLLPAMISLPLLRPTTLLPTNLQPSLNLIITLQPWIILPAVRRLMNPPTKCNNLRSPNPSLRLQVELQQFDPESFSPSTLIQLTSQSIAAFYDAFSSFFSLNLTFPFSV